MTIQKFKNTYRIDSTRLQHWDYGWNATYFVTICTRQRAFYFGDIKDGIMGLSDIGCLACEFWYSIPDHFPFVILDAFVVMPNHVHGIIVINKPDGGMDENRYVSITSVETGRCPVSTQHRPVSKIDVRTNQSIGQLRARNQGQNTLSSIIGSYKSAVTKYAHKINADFAWQSRFYDHIIRDDKSYENIVDYIHDNPRRWDQDRYFG